MLARIVNYSNEVHIDKMKEVILDKLQNVLVIYKITNQSPKTQDDYLKLLMQAYKALHLNKAQGTIFSLEVNREKSGGKKDPDAIKIDEIQKKEGKSLQYYQICAEKDFRNKTKLYNIVDYYDKPGNEKKHSQKSSSQKPSLLGPSKSKNQSFRAQLMKLLKEESNDLESSPEAINVNSTSIEEIPDPIPPSRKGKGTPKLDFPLGPQNIMSIIYSQRIVYSQLAHKSWKQYQRLVIIQCTIRLPPLKFQLYFGYTAKKHKPRLQLIQELPRTLLTELSWKIITW